MLILSTPSDPFRVLAGNGDIADDLDPGVLFSSKWRGGFSEYFEQGIGATGSGSFGFSRAYAGCPYVLACISAGGDVYYPYEWWLQNQNGQGNIVLISQDYFRVRVNTTYLQWYALNIPGGSGTLRIWVFG